MLSYYPCMFSRSEVKDPTLAGSRFFRKNIEDWKPVRMVQVKRMKYSIANIQQPFFTGGKKHNHVTRGMSRSCRLLIHLTARSVWRKGAVSALAMDPYVCR